jgi:hypothetical protein
MIKPSYDSYSLIHVGPKSDNLKHPLVLTAVFRFKLASLLVISQRCELCIEHGGSHLEQEMVNSVINKEISNVN